MPQGLGGVRHGLGCRRVQCLKGKSRRASRSRRLILLTAMNPRRSDSASCRHYRHRASFLVDSIGDAIIATDVAGIIHWLNPVAERMTGWTKAEAVGRPLAKVFVIINEEARMAAIDPVAACIKQGEIVGMADRTMLLSRNGDEYGIEDSASPIRGEDRECHGVVLVADCSDGNRQCHAGTASLRGTAAFEARGRNGRPTRCVPAGSGVDFLKIDGQFVTGMLDDAAVRCFREVAKSGLQV